MTPLEADLDKLDAAVVYAGRGWPVFPCHGKTPLTTNGFKNASADADQVRAWWARWPAANVAIATGQVSGVFVVDIDEGGEETIRDLQRRHGALPTAPWVRTGGGGWHLYLAHPGLPGFGNTAGKLGPGVDTRGDGGYVIAPPSVHPSGIPYTWETTGALAPVPGWLCRLANPAAVHRPRTHVVAGGASSAARALEGVCRVVVDAPPGTANDRLNWAAWTMRPRVEASQLPAHEVVAALLDAALARGVPHGEAAATIGSGLGIGKVAR